MARKTYSSVVLILALFLFHSTPLCAQPAQPSAGRDGKEINVTADTLTAGEGGARIEAKGNVEIKRAEMTLKADEVRMNRTTQEVEARGNVSVDDPEWKLKSADSLQLNLEKETGTIERGDLFLERGHLSATGKRFQKFTGQAYHIDEGFFTTCLCESGPPTWKISADEIDLSREGDGTIRRGTFYLMDIPILYVPYGYFPVRTERQSGFLMPHIGFSSKYGFRYEQPFFWAISKSDDATFGFDLEARARVGLLGEYRTVFSRDARAQINLSYFNEGLRTNEDKSIRDHTIADAEIPQDRWNVAATHRATLGGWTTYSDIATYSDDLFLRELVRRLQQNIDSTEQRSLKTSRYSPSRLGFLRNWGDVSLSGEWAYYQDFIQEDNRTFQKTPQIVFKGRRLMETIPLELSWRAEGVQYVRQKNADGLRLDLRPEIVLPFRAAPYLFGSLDVAPRETLYHLYSTSGGAFDRDKSRALFEVRGNIGTSVGRIFDWDGSSLKKIKHVVEPELSYLFIPGSRQSDIPVMDSTDRINRRNVLTFSLSNRFWGKFAEEPVGLPADRDVELVTSPTVGNVREMGRLRLALSYDVDKERKGGDSLSDLDVNLRVTPLDYLALGLDTGLNPGPWQFSHAALRLSLSDPTPITRRVLDPDFMRPNSLDLSYRFIRRTPKVGEVSNSVLADCANFNFLTLTCLHDPTPFTAKEFNRNVLGLLGFHLFYHLTDHLLFIYDSTYNTRDSRFTTNRGGIKLLSQCECWTVTVSLNRDTNPSETSFRFTFNLLGLGSQVKDIFR